VSVPLTRGHWLDAGVILALALGLRVLYAVELADDPFGHDLISNAELYHTEAVKIADGGKLARDTGFQPLFAWALGGTYALAGPRPEIARLAQSLLGALTAALVTLIGASLAGRRAGRLAGLGFALFWPAVFYGGELLPDTLVCTALAVALLAYVRALGGGGAPAWIAGGLGLGLACLAKPNALLLTPWPAIAALASPELAAGLRRRRALLGLTAPLAAAIALAFGPLLFEGDSGDTTASFATKTLWDGNQREADGINPFIQEFERIEDWGVWDDLDDTEAIAGALRGDLIDFAVQEPGALAGLQLRKALIYLSTWEVANNYTVQWRRARSTVLGLPLWVGFGGLLALALAGLASVAPRWRTHVLPLGWGLTWSASFVAILVAGRYRLPAATVLAVYAGVGVAALLRAAGERDRRTIGLLLGALVLGVVLSTPDYLGLRHYGIASVLEMEAHVLERAGDVEGAEERYLAGIDLERFGPETESAYGLFLIRHGRPDEGLEAMRRAAARDPDDPDLAKDLGGALRDGGRPDEAVAILVAAAERDPGDAGIAYNLGLALADLGQLDPADVALSRALDLGADPGTVHLERGVIRARQGRWEAAEGDLVAALEALPGHCAPVANLGLLYEKTDRPTEAAELYARCPEDPACSRRLERLRGDDR